MQISPTKFLKDLIDEIYKDNVGSGAGALAFFLMFSIFPAMIFVLSLTPYLGIPQLEEQIMDFLSQSMPGDAAIVFLSAISGIVSSSTRGLLSFGLIATLWSASTGFYAIMLQLNVTLKAHEDRSYLRGRAVALLILFLFTLLIVGSFLLIIFGGVLHDWILQITGWKLTLAYTFAVLRWVVIALAVNLGFSLIYYIGPNIKHRFRFITWGSVFATVVIAVASLAFRYYVANFADYNAVYGSLGAAMALMIWLYIVGWVILLGSEIDCLARRYKEARVEQKRKAAGIPTAPSPA